MGMSRLTTDEQETFTELFSKFIGETSEKPFEKLVEGLRDEP